MSTPSRQTSRPDEGDTQRSAGDATSRSGVTSRRSGGVGSATRLMSKKRLNQYLLKNWTEILFVPLIPSVVSLLTIFFGSIILNTASLDCVQPLNSFAAADVVFAYFILFGYTWLLIGPIPVQSLINVAMTMFGFGLVLFFFYVVGSGMLGASGPCADTSPALYQFVQFKIACFWIGFLVWIGYMVKHFYLWKTKRLREHAEHVLDNERQVARIQEEDGEDEDEDK